MYKIKDLHQYSKKLNVLYVEDDKDLREETSALFRMIFKSTDFAVDGLDGLNKYNENIYDLVITDINMPNMNGIEMSEKIKEINSEQKIVVISAHDESNILINLIKTGASGFILKPMKMEVLIHSMYPVCRDVCTQLINIELVNELNEKNSLLEKQNKELRSLNNVVKTKHQQLGEIIQVCKEKTQENVKKSVQITQQDSKVDLKEEIRAVVQNKIVDAYFKADEDEGDNNVVFLSDHGADLSEIFTEIPEIISRFSEEPDVEDIKKISKNIAKASSILVYYSPYLDLLSTSLSELSVAMENNHEAFIDIMKIDTQSVLMLFDAVSSDMERYVERFSIESLAMKNIHHIHEPTALSIQQIITLIQPPPDDEGDMEFF